VLRTGVVATHGSALAPPPALICPPAGGYVTGLDLHFGEDPYMYTDAFVQGVKIRCSRWAVHCRGTARDVDRLNRRPARCS